MADRHVVYGLAALLLGALGAACTNASETPSPPTPTADAGTDACTAGQTTLGDGSCLAAGVQPDGCTAGELGVDGACVPAGIPPDGCAEGFVSDTGFELTGSLVERATGRGIYLEAAAANIERSAVRETQASPADGGCRGINVRDGSDSQLRGSLSLRGSLMAVGSTALDCNPIQLAGQDYLGRSFGYQNLFGNRCGCQNVETECQVLTSDLMPPEAVSPAD
jgi:hypothetical protein